MTELFKSVTDWYMANINYFTITLLMSVESSFIPFPSEVIIPPAAWKAAKGELNIFLVVFSGTIGAMIGALFNYYFAMHLGRKLIYRFAETRIANMMLVDRHGVEKSEQFFIKYGNMSTLVGRLIPGIRQLISIPAGLARMDMKPFLLFTFIGSSLWNIILALLGYFLYSQKDLLEEYYRELSYGFLILGILFAVLIVYKGFFSKRDKPAGE